MFSDVGKFIIVYKKNTTPKQAQNKKQNTKQKKTIASKTAWITSVKKEKRNTKKSHPKR